MTLLKKGDRVRMRADETHDWSIGVVILASPNGVAIAVNFEDDVIRTETGGMFIGSVPFTVDYERELVEDLMGNGYDLEVSV
jgi:hypothetical protein